MPIATASCLAGGGVFFNPTFRNTGNTCSQGDKRRTPSLPASPLSFGEQLAAQRVTLEFISTSGSADWPIVPGKRSLMRATLQALVS
ncbi:hypothetical protein [Bradyrhizobium sp. CIR3A]|uniref:hypothetical protein n=1 Tax=Bradyrhizobium sp. CIR3A TaxID=2663838 RepID=UPI001606E3B4|nr:hypothetical protein [Bradyrhizobium sp. CIR3A]MBB4263117.1 hypothetical protein [Bradyrhizobium sp. CIR3A]